ncbi:dihydrofolate reductase-like [Convolutriloba macropyga]|uniref:dihydrofolate reductase-like n=1 Tax=Convolutriloba macropyga TaxID=536237 RepID=UPI003F52780E
MSNLPNLNIIVAACHGNGIGFQGRLPWFLPAEMRYFREVTQERREELLNTCERNACIMGRKTWESIPDRFKPLKNRWNLVVSNTLTQSDFGDHSVDQIVVVRSLQEAMEKIAENGKIDRTWVIGGNRLYQEAMATDQIENIYFTEIDAEFECDVFFPQIDSQRFELSSKSELHEENDLKYKFLIYRKISNKCSCAV